MVNKDILVDRFLKYVKFDTQSNQKSITAPSTSKQLILANYLAEEMARKGLQGVELTKHGVLTGFLESNLNYNVPAVGFIAHMDTSPDVSGANVNPRVIKYDGEIIKLSEDGKVTLSPEEFPELLKYIGEELIITDGTTLLGADDKAGIAAIMSAVQYFAENPEIPHGKICIGFTPDEEIGYGVANFDVNKFGAEFAYTVDGGALGTIEYENFNAANATIKIKGRNVHPGASKNKMINSISIACEFQEMLPVAEKPQFTENYEGFYHVNGISGNVEMTSISMLIRDHDGTKFASKKEQLYNIANFLNNKYGKDTVEISIQDMYKNMKEKITPVMHIIDLAKKAMEDANVTPVTIPVRGGTDGAMLSFMGLPCPNLFTGGHNFHGRQEFIPINSMVKSSEVIINIIKRVAQNC